jgi:hypothetical protein
MAEKWIRRPKEDSPFYAHLCKYFPESADNYGGKVDRFLESGLVSITLFGRTDRDPGEGSYYLGIPRSVRSGVVPSDDGGAGRSATPRSWLRDEDAKRALVNT